MELKDTIDDMLSDDYKKRFIAEYNQLYCRILKLENIIVNWDNLDFTPTSSYNDLLMQLHYMHMYKKILSKRAYDEYIKLPNSNGFIEE